MVKKHPFASRVDPDPLVERRFRWVVVEGDQIHVRSPQSYATQREAELEAGRALQKRAESWFDPRTHNLRTL
jgi:hypothetical protein